MSFSVTDMGLVMLIMFLGARAEWLERLWILHAQICPSVSPRPPKMPRYYTGLSYVLCNCLNVLDDQFIPE